MRLFVGASLFFSSAGCKEQTPEEAFKICTDTENRYNAINDKIEEAQKNGTLTAQSEEAYSKESDALFEETKAAYARFFAAHINSPFAQKIFSETRWVRRLNSVQLKSVIEKVADGQFMSTETYKKAADRVKYMELSQVGKPYINIVSCDTAGNTVELAQFAAKGKYLLIDFWASWCPDCRKEMPDLVELYDSFKDKNFEIVGYSLDNKKEAWMKGITDLNISWFQMSDLDYWNSKGALYYGVRWIPTTILLSPEGKIIERGLTPKELKKKLAELL
jgi:thiol-disulfide isomerase/thioredoxin